MPDPELIDVNVEDELADKEVEEELLTLDDAELVEDKSQRAVADDELEADVELVAGPVVVDEQDELDEDKEPLALEGAELSWRWGTLSSR